MRRLLTTLLILTLPAAALAGPSIVGSFQGWDPADPAMNLQPLGDHGYTLTLTLPAGTHEYKCVETDAWEGTDFPGYNIVFDLTEETAVTFFANLGANVGVIDFDEFVAHRAPILAGDFIDLFGGNEWDPADPAGLMTQMPGTDLFVLSGILPAGHHECKVTLNGNWDQNTGGNTALDLDVESIVTFTYEFGTNTLTVDSVVPVAERSFSAVKALY
ncbi:MAG: hypothetical protein JW819_00385 [Candidatus Krumholzibacteriota bacterium]|nr:hypothetical protein [Candidatus Krumholzibacteriota bacterium]